MRVHFIGSASNRTVNMHINYLRFLEQGLQKVIWSAALLVLPSNSNHEVPASFASHYQNQKEDTKPSIKNKLLYIRQWCKH